MKIPSHQLSAFSAVAQIGNFSKAAKSLGLTQSALSQRISNLENDLETTLLIRETSGIQLTSAGEMLLRYCQTTQSLEEEVLKQLTSTSEELAGTFRIAAFSSVLSSVIIPALSPFLRQHPNVQCEFKSYEVAELIDVLRSSRADLIVLDYVLEKQGIASETIGQEEYVVIESAKYKTPKDLYLDHGPHDVATETFFRSQPTSSLKLRRSFAGGIYEIISAVEEGLGRAVMSKHLLRNNKKIKTVNGFKKYELDISLNYFEQPFYSALHKEIVQEIAKNAQKFLI